MTNWRRDTLALLPSAARLCLICPFVYSCVHLFVQPVVYQFVYPFAYPFLHFFPCPHVHSRVCLFLHTCFHSSHPSIHLNHLFISTIPPYRPSFISTIYSSQPSIHLTHPFILTINSSQPSIHPAHPFISTIHSSHPSIHITLYLSIGPFVRLFLRPPIR